MGGVFLHCTRTISHIAIHVTIFLCTRKRLEVNERAIIVLLL